MLRHRASQTLYRSLPPYLVDISSSACCIIQPVGILFLGDAGASRIHLPPRPHLEQYRQVMVRVLDCLACPLALAFFLADGAASSPIRGTAAGELDATPTSALRSFLGWGSRIVAVDKLGAGVEARRITRRPQRTKSRKAPSPSGTLSSTSSKSASVRSSYFYIFQPKLKHCADFSAQLACDEVAVDDRTHEPRLPHD